MYFSAMNNGSAGCNKRGQRNGAPYQNPNRQLLDEFSARMINWQNEMITYQNNEFQQFAKYFMAPQSTSVHTGNQQINVSRVPCNIETTTPSPPPTAQQNTVAVTQGTKNRQDMKNNQPEKLLVKS